MSINNKNVIYQITSKINKKIYIGSSVKFSRRKALHKHHLIKGTHNNPKLQNHVNKYGFEDLIFSIIEQVDVEKNNTIKREQYYIDTLKPYFNIHIVAQSPKGLKRTPEQIQRMMMGKKRKSGWKLSPEACLAISIRNKGKKISEESNELRRLKMTGRKFHTEESKQKIRISATGRRHSEESKEKMSKKAMGNKNGIGKRPEWFGELISKSRSKIIVLQFDLNGTFIKEFESIRLAAMSVDGNKALINMAINGKRKKHKGFIWKRKN